MSTTRVHSILVVDDSFTVRHQLRTMLEGAGYRVMDAANGEAGLQLARGRRFDLVFADVNMPGIDGLEMIQRIRALSDYDATPIFVLTTESSPSVVARGREAGATAWIVKPFNPELVLRAVAKVLKAPAVAGTRAP